MNATFKQWHSWRGFKRESDLFFKSKWTLGFVTIWRCEPWLADRLWDVIALLKPDEPTP